LKAFLEKDTHIQVDTIHPYLEIAASLGTDTYRLISNDSWAGEALYSPLLFPEQYKQAKQLFYSRFGAKHRNMLNYDALQKKLHHGLENMVENICADYDLFGMTICFNQLFSSLTAAHLLKTRNDTPIVIGGSSCVGEIGNTLLDNFPQIDFVIDGEGETALHALCLSLAHLSAPPRSHQIISRPGRNSTTSISNDEIQDLDTLPAPDYSSYFKELSTHFADQPFIPTLPIEFSRGCWWNKCRFCNLNLQWRHFRSKSGKQCVKEVEKLADKHKCLNFTFTDNALPIKESDLFFRTLTEKNKDYHFFAEIRVITDPDRMQLYQRGGLTSVQVGIESLSTNLLRKFRKGTSAIENIAVMRQSAETGIILNGNLITEFPGSEKEDVVETLHALDFVLPYNPLISASFFLGYGSPVHSNPKKYGIRAVTQHPNNRKLFPKTVLSTMETLVRDYRGDRLQQRSLWKPVIKKIRLWHKFHQLRKRVDIPPLNYRDGGSFLIIRQELVDNKPLQHRLTGTSRTIYLYCTTIRTFDEISDTFSQVNRESLHTFLDDLVKKYLVFYEQNRYLSLAVRDF